MFKLNLKIWMTCITAAVVLLVACAPNLADAYGSQVAIVLILLCGIPHGATDHILFRHINKDYDKGWISRFIVRYFLLMGLFALVWWILPSLALMIFLAISAYHFGQSEWHKIKAANSMMYSVWGAFVLAAPLLWNYSETAPIITALIGQEFLISSDYQLFIPFFFLGLSIFCIVFFYFKKQLSLQKCLRETAKLALLSILFYSTSLLVSFAVYFVFWHSVSSIQDQITQLKEVDQDYNYQKYFQQIIPFTLGAFAGIGVFSFYSPASLMSADWISQFFILISVVTLPHSLLMDAFLEEKVSAISIKHKVPQPKKRRFSSERVQAT